MSVGRCVIAMVAVVVAATSGQSVGTRRAEPARDRAATQSSAPRDDYFTLLDVYRTGDAHRAVTKLIHLEKNKLPSVELLLRQANDRLRALLVMHLEALVESGTVEPHASIAVAALRECRKRPAAPDDFTRSAAIVLGSALLALGEFPTESVLRAGGLRNPEILLLAGGILEWRALDTMSQPGKGAGILVGRGARRGGGRTRDRFVGGKRSNGTLRRGVCRSVARRPGHRPFLALVVQ